jgi:hypothetical protein
MTREVYATGKVQDHNVQHRIMKNRPAAKNIQQSSTAQEIILQDRIQQTSEIPHETAATAEMSPNSLFGPGMASKLNYNPHSEAHRTRNLRSLLSIRNLSSYAQHLEAPGSSVPNARNACCGDMLSYELGWNP